MVAIEILVSNYFVEVKKPSPKVRIFTKIAVRLLIILPDSRSVGEREQSILLFTSTHTLVENICCASLE